MKKAIHKLICFYFLISCLMMTLCFLAVAVDCANAASTGKFRFLPSLNALLLKTGATEAENYRLFYESADFRAQLQIAWDRCNDPLWRCINAGTVAAMGNLLVYYLLHLLNARFPRWMFRMVIANAGMALTLIVLARVFARGRWGSFLAAAYPVAFDALKIFFIPVFAAAIFAGIIKGTRRESASGDLENA